MEVELVSQIIVALWYIGIVTSFLCLLIQIFLYIVLPSSRKLDQKILTQLTIARLITAVFEYGSIYPSDDVVKTCILILVYVHSDFAIVCWMSVFTKRLYDRLVLVFVDDMNFVCVSVTVWLLALPAGLICSGVMYIDLNNLYKFCSIYCLVKCTILTINLLIFCRIFRVVISAKSDRDFRSTMKACINSLLLLSVTGLQVFIRFIHTDNAPFLVPNQNDYRNAFLILFILISCYQVMAVTFIFVMILKAANRSKQTIMEKITIKFKNCNNWV